MKRAVLILTILLTSLASSFAWEDAQMMSATGYNSTGGGQTQDNYMVVNINASCDFFQLTGFVSSEHDDAAFSAGAWGNNGLYYTYNYPADGGKSFQYGTSGTLYWETVNVFMEVYHGYAEVLLRWGAF